MFGEAKENDNFDTYPFDQNALTMNTSITEQTIESYFNLIRNWDATSKRLLMDRISSSIQSGGFSKKEQQTLLNDLSAGTQLELLIDETRRN
ncbi:hypothetical protein LX69_00910 [Breznakibacter xylanolyticus]|uniref:Uncharacterized protein n=1 Tax=Breznakibacter xylanolyticus TaxID=990 RepID=A0A2W7NIG1_9BACT|nr:hypothetical protein [Breznakibacter xylanolyticus]PZX19243.1 hypothetical protein LX69_00910 [Breznakibacter xylanolyticus]